MFFSRINITNVYPILVLVTILLGCSEESHKTLTPKKAIEIFYEVDVAEDQLMDPLIISGYEVVPLVIDDILDKDMKRRRYAIGALGNIGDKSAISTLEQILMDKSEDSYIRCDAINSIAMIDYGKGKELAESFKSSPVDCLTKFQFEIVSSEYEDWLNKNYMRRTLEEARAGKHH